MTYPDYEDDQTEDNEQEQSRTVTLDRKQIRSLERDAKSAREANGKVAELERRLAFSDAGINASVDPKLKYFVAGYSGDITAEAIRAAAEEAGFLTPVTPQASDAEMAAHDRVSDASAGAGNRPQDDPVAKLREAAATGGRQAVLDQIRKDGRRVVNG